MRLIEEGRKVAEGLDARQLVGFALTLSITLNFVVVEKLSLRI